MCRAGVIRLLETSFSRRSTSSGRDLTSPSFKKSKVRTRARSRRCMSATESLPTLKLKIVGRSDTMTLHHGNITVQIVPHGSEA